MIYDCIRKMILSKKTGLSAYITNYMTLYYLITYNKVIYFTISIKMGWINLTKVAFVLLLILNYYSEFTIL